MSCGDAAVAYAHLGWHVVPLWWPIGGACACGDATCDSPGKHPHRLAPHGLKDASADPEVVASWFDAVPGLNVGLRTGISFDVLDLDCPEAGTWLASHAAKNDADTDTCWAWGPMSITGKGHHLLYAPTGAGNRTRINGVAGLDWRGKDGYIVAPPSLHASGRRYEWHPDCGPDAPVPEAPTFLANLALRKTDKAADERRPTGTCVTLNHRSFGGRSGGRWSDSGLVSAVALAAEGERNTVLNWAAAKVGADVRAGKATVEQAVGALDRLAVAAERAGLDGKEVDRTVRSGYNAGLDGRAA